MKLNKSLHIVLCIIILLPTLVVADKSTQSLSGQVNSKPRFAYTANPYDFTISQYVIDHDGLMHANGMTFVKDKFPAFLAVHPNQQLIYVGSRTIDMLRGYKIDSLSGRLTEIDSPPFNSGLRSPFFGTFHPSGDFLYLAGRGGGVGAYKVDAKSGQLTDVSGQPFKSGERTRSLAVHPSGRFLYAPNAYTNNISAYSINQSTGVLLPIPNSPFFAGEEGPFDDTVAKLADVNNNKGGLPYYIAIHPEGKFAYVNNFVAGSISIFSIDQKTGELTLVDKPVDAGITPYPVIVHPNGNFLYIATWGDNEVWVYEINKATGKLSVRKDLQVQTHTLKPVDISLSKNGDRMYVSSIGTHDASVFSVDVKTSKLTWLQNIKSREGAIDIEIVEAAQATRIEANYAYIIDAKSKQLKSYRVDESNGGLTLASTISTGTNPSDVAHDPKGRSVYVVNRDDNTVSSYAVDNLNGSLSPIIGSPFVVGESPNAIVIDANGWYAYISNAKSHNVSIYLLHKDSGELAEARGSPMVVSNNPSDVVVDNFGRFSYVISDYQQKEDDHSHEGDANSQTEEHLHEKEPSKQIASFRYRSAITSARFEMKKYGSPFAVSDQPTAFKTEPNGRFAILANGDKDSLSVYRMYYANGTIHEIKSSPFKVGDTPVDIAVHPDSKYIYSANKNSRDITFLTMDGVSGELTKADTIELKQKPKKLYIEPSGRIMYVQIEKLAGFLRFEINPGNGKLTKLSNIELGYQPIAMSISAAFH